MNISLPLFLERPLRVAGRKTVRLTDLLALGRQRRALARLEPRLLDDIGVSASEAQAEARRPVWDVPASWRI